MSAAEAIVMREPMPQLTSYFKPTDADLALYAEWMRRVAFAPTDALTDNAFVLGRLMVASEQMAKWLKDRESDIARITRERDQYMLAAQTNAETIRSMIELRDAADEVAS